LIYPSAEIVDVVDQDDTVAGYAARAEFMEVDALRAKLEGWQLAPDGREANECRLSQR
jgi:hypothetical protein